MLELFRAWAQTGVRTHLKLQIPFSSKCQSHRSGLRCLPSSSRLQFQSNTNVLGTATTSWNGQKSEDPFSDAGRIHYSCAQKLLILKAQGEGKKKKEATKEATKHDSLCSFSSFTEPHLSLYFCCQTHPHKADCVCRCLVWYVCFNLVLHSPTCPCPCAVLCPVTQN